MRRGVSLALGRYGNKSRAHVVLPQLFRMPESEPSVSAPDVKCMCILEIYVGCVRAHSTSPARALSLHCAHVAATPNPPPVLYDQMKLTQNNLRRQWCLYSIEARHVANTRCRLKLAVCGVHFILCGACSSYA